MKPCYPVLLLLAAPALAQPAPQGDPRYRTIPFDGRSSYQIPTSPDTNQVVLFDRDERIVSVVLSDPNAFYVTVSGSGDSIAFKAAREAALAMMSVRTKERSYDLELVSAGSDPAPQVVRFSYAAEAASQAPPMVHPQSHDNATYRLTGSKTLLPVSIGDDGEKTYLAWGEHQAVPAVFAVGPDGDEQMVDGYVRAGQFTIDRIYEALVFRIDRQSARAQRVAQDNRKSK